MKPLLIMRFAILLIATATLLFLISNSPSWTIDKKGWFKPAIYSVFGLFIALMVLVAFTSSRKKRQTSFADHEGELLLNKRAIEKNIRYTIAKYEDVRQPNISVQMYDKQKTSYIDIAIDVFIGQTTNAQMLKKKIRQDVKTSTEHFSQLPVRNVKINMVDQKLMDKRIM